MSILTRIFGDPNIENTKQYEEKVAQVNALESEISKLSLDDLRARSLTLRERVQKGAKVDDVLAEAFALVRAASVRTKEVTLTVPLGKQGLRHFDVQLMAGIALHEGKISEMKTGEGKTLVATLPLYLNALEGKGAHLVTVNDYLARYHAAWMGQIYHVLGLSTGCIQHEGGYVFDLTATDDEHHLYLRSVSRQEAYAADITYGTNNEFGFDYLRDNMVPGREQKVQRGLHYAIVDEVDSILIDEARTPLIISAPAEDATQKYFQFATLAETLQENTDYNVDEKMKAVTLTDAGISHVENVLGVKNLYEERGIQDIHHIEQALKAKALFHKDKDYVLKDGEVVIVDEFTGRLMEGRRYSEGLHQAIEAKERVEIKQESVTLATITFQNYFRLYNKLAGMTGTAATEAEEFRKIYNLGVVVVPTNQPMVRADRSDKIYKTEVAKFNAVVEEIKQLHILGRPVLVGTISIEKSEALSMLLQREGVEHDVLNAKHHEQEAKIIAQAGKKGRVTIATNMAGRGTDIMLGGDPQDAREAQEVVAAGGLAVLGTERHEARRIDNQLRGRSGRQGDPGTSQFFISLEDDLMRIFGSERLKNLMTTLGVPDDVPIENKLISRQIEAAQKKVEGYNFDVRKNLVEYDDVMNKHREVVYKRRNDVLASEDLPLGYRTEIMDIVTDEIEQVVMFHSSGEKEQDWDLKEIIETMKTIFPVDMNVEQAVVNFKKQAGDKLQDATARTAMIDELKQSAELAYAAVETRLGADTVRKIERAVALRAIDVHWVEHLDIMTRLREGIGLQGYGQRNPLVEYKKEAYRLFTELLASIQKQIVYSIFKVHIHVPEVPSVTERKDLQLKGAEEPAGGMPLASRPGAPRSLMQKESGNRKESDAVAAKPRDDEGHKIGRNDPCFCGSGKKYKKCHGK
ncbi:MAG: preprotein translocase subunit SecA [Candidatus Kerfeldbacteria bacterium]|nr:preprotein translocase subunit SecA [Candidatus Kerfeldbacteria bacterium]